MSNVFSLAAAVLAVRARLTRRWLDLRCKLPGYVAVRALLSYHPFLRWYEAAALRLLLKSPRVGSILVKQHGEPCTWLLRDSSDALPLVVTAGDDSEPEPVSMMLERLFHEPDAER